MALRLWSKWKKRKEGKKVETQERSESIRHASSHTPDDTTAEASNLQDSAAKTDLCDETLKKTSNLPTEGSQSDTFTPSDTIIREAAPIHLDLDTNSSWTSCEESDRLWDTAYDTLKTENRKVVTWHEKNVCDSILEEKGISQTDPHARRQQMKRFIDGWISKKDAKPEDVWRNSSSLIKILYSTWKRSSQSTLAWVGLCCACQIFLSPTLRLLKGREGLIHIISRMPWYSSLPKLLAPDDVKNRNNSTPREDQLRKRIVDLYKAILLYEMLFANPRHGTSLRDIPGDMSKPDVWDARIGDVYAAETALETFDSEEIVTQLNELTDSDVDKQRNPPINSERVNSKDHETSLNRLEAITARDTIPSFGPHADPWMNQLYLWITSTREYTGFTYKAGNGYDNRIFWVSGGPGRGKTMLLTALVQQLSEREEIMPKSWLLGYFFCNNRAPKVRHATAVVKSLISQLLAQQPSLITHLEERHELTKRKRFSSPNDFAAMSGVLYDILVDQTSSNTYLLVLDAVDDTPLYGDWPGPDDLLRLIRMTADQCPRVKWIISTNFSSRVQDFLRQGNSDCCHLNLDYNHEGLLLAMDTYISQQISTLAEERQYDEELEREITESVRNKSPENLVWFNMVYRALSLEQRWYTLELIDGLPAGLTSLCNKQMRHIKTLRNVSFCTQVLSTMAIAFRPTHIWELAVLSKLPERVEIRSIVRESSPFLDVNDNMVYFMHESSRHYVYQTLIQSGEVLLDHAIMVQRCLMVLSGFLSEYRCHTLEPSTKKAQWANAIQYSMTGWIQHAMQLENLSSALEVVEIITKFLKDHILQWVEVLVLTSHLPIALTMIRKLDLSLSVSEMTSIDTVDTLHDAHGLLKLYETMDNDGLFPTIYSALLFCPDESRTKNSFMPGLFPWVKTTPRVGDKWRRNFLILRGHSDWIRKITFSPNGQFLASASDDRTVRVWDTATGTTQHTLKGHKDWVYSVAISSTGIIASGSDDDTVRLWSASTGHPYVTLGKQPNTVKHLSFSHDESKLAVSTGEVVRLYDLSTYKYCDLERPSKYAIFSPDGILLVSISATDKKTIHIWDAKTLKFIRDLEGHEEVDALAFSPKLPHMASCSEDSTITIWDTKTWSVIHRLTSNGHVTSISFFPDGSRLASWSDNTIRIWNIDTGKQQDAIRGYGDPPKVVAVSPNGQYIASAANDAIIRFWFANSNGVKDMEDTDSAQPYDQSRSGVTAITISPNGKYIASADYDKEIRLWDGNTGQRLHENAKLGHNSVVNSLVFSPNEDILASSSNDRTVRLWDLSNGKLMYILEGHKDWVRQTTFSPDGKFIVSASDDKGVRVWEVPNKGEGAESAENLPMKKKLSGHKGYCRTVAFSSNGEFLVSGGDDYQVVIWKVDTWEKFREPINTGANVLCVAVSPDSARILSSESSDQLKIWELQTGKCLYTIKTEQKINPYKLAFDPKNPNYVITDVGTLRLQKNEDEGILTLSQQQPSWCPYALKHIDSWMITWKGHNVIGIPEKYRPHDLRHPTTCVTGRKIAIGCASGEVLLFEFSDEIKPRISAGS
ncbi:WD40-repeat-containing domain protein [Hypoxylon rubiginosum]|uniref:WD40-repeat-containing domain protein n=1 Tax=Hypoxylon rubiginosum TaxID=110542 RepID=A0ACB9YT80_9PEZI|nr:WD40-repeat-containing domain protein [Hypoxylon rubiginosum]